MTGVNVSLAWMPMAVLLSSAISAIVLWAVASFRRKAPKKEADPVASQTVFLLKDHMVVDQSPGQVAATGFKTWPELRDWFAERFEGLPETLADKTDGSTHVFHPTSTDDDAVLTLRYTPQGQSITLEDPTMPCASERHALIVENRQACSWRRVLEHAPLIVFTMTNAGVLTWGNANFEKLSLEERPVFLQAVRDRDAETKVQLSLDDADAARKRHYELSVIPVDDNVVVYANDVTRLIEADSVRNAFVQTLTKTFADLSTGLGVFDRDHRLVLFNPAVLDLTDLPAEFLSARPHMIEFFDRLRDNHMMPEPKSYSTWRGQIADMIKSAEDGHYSESWSLPGGLTYKLTGRPHPNGAIAFLIEDITDEMTMTRQSRSQLETHQAILDAMKEAIAVVAPDGGLLVCNAAFADVVGFDPDASLTPTCLKDVVRACRQQFPAHQIWDELSTQSLRKPVTARLRNGSGQLFHLRGEPLRDGLFMLNLSVPTPSVPLSA